MRTTRMRPLVVLTALALLAACGQPAAPTPAPTALPPYWPAADWRTCTPEEQGFDSDKLAQALQTLHERGAAIDSLLLIRHGYVVLDACFYPYNDTAMHDLASVTKTVMGILTGIAADQVKLDLDQPMISFFPGRTIANLDARKGQVTVRHLVRMANGLQSGCMARDEENLDAMRATADWVQAALDRPTVREPGTRFCYDSPGLHLLSAILQQATGQTALEFAREYLFAPLGIGDALWQADAQGITHGWGDLRLRPHDAARIGYLWLQGGVWDGRQVVSAAWVAEASQAQTSGAAPDDYGYGWWVAGDGYYASGRGGQTIRVSPSLQTVAVMTASGSDWDEVGPLLRAALLDAEKPLPANAAAVARLQATLADLAQVPEPQPVPPLPAMASEISGRLYRFGPNDARVETLRLEFGPAAEAHLSITRPGSAEVIPKAVGLDGNYRLAADGEALRGSWSDEQTFVLESYDLGHTIFRLIFEGQRVTVESPQQGLRLEGGN